MAVKKMKSLQLVAHSSLRETIIPKLHEQGLVHIEDYNKQVEEEFPELALEQSIDMNDIALRIAKARFLDEFTKKYSTKKKDFIDNLMKERVGVTKEEFFSVRESFDFEKIYQDAELVDKEFFQIDERRSRIEEIENELRHWKSINMPLNEISSTENVVILAGRVPAKATSAFKDHTESISNMLQLIEVSGDSQFTRFVIIYHRSVSHEVDDVLTLNEFTPLEDFGIEASPVEALREMDEERERLGVEREDALAKAAELSEHRKNVVILHEYLCNMRDRLEAVRSFAHTKSAFAMDAWVAEDDEEEVVSMIESIDPAVEIITREPDEDETPPTDTKYPSWLRPFWHITKLYGYPEYREFDPTFITAPFFIIYFGMCLGDVGYGITLALFSLYMRKKLLLTGLAKDFLTLLIYAGASAAVFGVLGASYFGIEFESLPAFMRNAGVLLAIPNEETGMGSPYPFLILTLVFGIVQLMAGFIVEIADRIRNGKLLDALYDQVSVMAFWIGVGFFALGAALDVSAVRLAGIALLSVGALVQIAFGGRDSKSIAGRIGNGVFSFYGNLTGFFGDVLSYVRLFALGLATVLIAEVVNRIGSEITGIPVLGIVLFLLILVGGHTFNLAISFIGSFVHPLRLQYVEFFSKFYEDGARPFDPFSIKSTRLIFSENDEKIR